MIMRSPAGERANSAIPLLLLAITAAMCSRVTFALFDDPEGPNLVVVSGLGLVILLISLTVYFSGFFSEVRGLKRAAGAIPIQLIVAAAFYLALR